MNVKNTLNIMAAVSFCILSTISQAAVINDLPLIGLNETENTQFKALQGDYIYVDFWATWCKPCKKSFPFMVKLQKTFKDKNFKVIAISVDADKADAIKFLVDNPINFDVYHDVDGVIATQFEISGMPTSYLIDPKGNIISIHVGFNKDSQQAITEKLNHIFNK